MKYFVFLITISIISFSCVPTTEKIENKNGYSLSIISDSINTNFRGMSVINNQI